MSRFAKVLFDFLSWFVFVFVWNDLTQQAASTCYSIFCQDSFLCSFGMASHNKRQVRIRTASSCGIKQSSSRAASGNIAARITTLMHNSEEQHIGTAERTSSSSNKIMYCCMHAIQQPEAARLAQPFTLIVFGVYFHGSFHLLPWKLPTCKFYFHGIFHQLPCN